MEKRGRIDLDLLEARITALGAIGRSEAGGLHRFVYTLAWAEAKAAFGRWMTDIGLTTWEDAVGNLYGRLQGSEPGPVVMTGSHIDTVVNGGMYDGALGLHASLTAIESLQAAYGRPRRTIDLLVVCEEEGGRFSTEFWGARAVTGENRRADADRYVDRQGVTLAVAMTAAGYDPAGIETTGRDQIGCWLELHIEQGVTLEAGAIPLGIVDAIAGHVLWDVCVEGRQDHGGTAPMHLRRDALAGAAQMIAFACGVAERQGRPAVCTVGRIACEPRIVNVVPRKATFTLDIRDADPARFTAMLASIESALSTIAHERGLSVDIGKRLRRDPVPMDAGLVRLLEESASRLGYGALTMASMAGHDSEVMARHWPSAMIFVPSRGGRSHCPEEFTPIDEIVPGVEVLTEALYRLAYRGD